LAATAFVFLMLIFRAALPGCPDRRLPSPADLGAGDVAAVEDLGKLRKSGFEIVDDGVTFAHRLEGRVRRRRGRLADVRDRLGHSGEGIRSRGVRLSLDALPPEPLERHRPQPPGSRSGRFRRHRERQETESGRFGTHRERRGARNGRFATRRG
jgi:hypothetical protein